MKVLFMPNKKYLGEAAYSEQDLRSVEQSLRLYISNAMRFFNEEKLL